MKKSILSMLLLPLVLTAAQPEITLPENPRAWENTARKELAEFLSRSAKAGITSEGVEITQVVLERDDKLPQESWFYRTEKGRLTIGGSGRGLLYGVYCFLENELGIRFLADNVEKVPVYQELRELGKLNRSGRPALIYRDIFRNYLKDDKGKFAARLRLNRRGDAPISTSFGGTFNYGKPYHCHTFCFYLPEKKYLKTNPEYFSLIKGVRKGGFISGQLCLSNPEVAKVLLPKLRQNILDERAAAEKSGRAPSILFDLSMNDNAKSCECENCRKEIAEYGHSGQLLKFLNPIAETIGKEFPDVYLTTLAYFHCEELPKKPITPAKNLIIKFCDTITNQASGITAKENALYRERLEKWGKIADNLFIWDYSIAYHSQIFPYPSEFETAELTREYIKNHVSGIFWEHEHPDCSDMHELKVYVEAKTMENPALDNRKLIKEFCMDFYGRAGEMIFHARELLYRTRKKNNGFVPWMAYLPDFNFIDPATLAEMNRLFDEAEKAVAGDEKLSVRVRRARFGTDLLTACRIVEVTKVTNIDREKLAARLELAAAGKNLPEYCTKMCKNAVIGAKMMRNNLLYAKEIAPGTEFTGKGAFDLQIAGLFNYDPDLVTVAPDEKSPAGVALTIDAAKNAKGYQLPFEMGIHENNINKTLISKRFKEIPKDGSYRWYTLKPVNVTSGSYLYLSRTWKSQYRLIPAGKSDQHLEVRVLARFTGKLFNENTPGDAGTIRIARIVCIPVEKK